jgi:hypothetical protein
MLADLRRGVSLADTLTPDNALSRPHFGRKGESESTRMPESAMDARAGFFALAVSAALVMASGAMPGGDAMAQSDDAASVETDAAAPADDLAAQDDAVEQPVPRQKPVAARKPAKSDLDQSAVRAAPVRSAPRPTRTSTRAIALPKILGSYR